MRKERSGEERGGKGGRGEGGLQLKEALSVHTVWQQEETCVTSGQGLARRLQVLGISLKAWKQAHTDLQGSREACFRVK